MVTTRSSSSRIPHTPKSNSKCRFDFKFSTGALSEPRSAASTAVTPVTLKSVTLQDWWLVKTAEGKGLGVGGLASREKLGVRTFCSAAIAKRHSATTLETTDGVMITIFGCINRPRTHQNGFSPEVCNHFLIGFPYYWDQYYGEACTKRSNLTEDPNFLADSDMNSDRSSEDCIPSSLDYIPVTKMRDILMSLRGDPERCSLINVISESFSSKHSRNASTKSSEPVNPNTDNSSPDKTSNGIPIPAETPSKLKSCHRQSGANGIINRSDEESLSQCRISSNAVASVIRGVLTREGFLNKQKDALLTGVPVNFNISGVETIGNLSGTGICHSHSTEVKGVTEIPEMCTVRRSNRVKRLKYETLVNM